MWQKLEELWALLLPHAKQVIQQRGDACRRGNSTSRPTLTFWIKEKMTAILLPPSERCAERLMIPAKVELCREGSSGKHGFSFAELTQYKSSAILPKEPCHPGLCSPHLETWTKLSTILKQPSHQFSSWDFISQFLLCTKPRQHLVV